MSLIFKPPKALLAFVAGACLPFAFSPFSLFPIAILSPALLFLLWHNLSPAKSFFYGLLFGIGFFGFGISWVYISMYQFANVPLVAAIGITAILVVGMALYTAILGWFLTRFFHQPPISVLLLVYPTAWILAEWFRGWILTGFPWLLLGYSQIDSPLSGYAQLIGVYGIGWTVVFTSSLLVYLWQKRGQPQYFRSMGIVLMILLILWGGGMWLRTVSWTKPEGTPVQVALVQANIPQEFKWLSNYRLESLHHYLSLSQQHRDADIIIWPETAIPMFYHEAIPLIEILSEEKVVYQTDFLIGIPTVLNEFGQPISSYPTSASTYYNSIMSLSEPTGFYHKRHLVPFGEYIPFQAILGKLLEIFNVPFSEFSAGTYQQSTLYAAGQPVGVTICYEDVFPDLVRSNIPQATLLVNVSNDAWFGDSIAPHQHLEIARMRALETGRYLLRATNTGITAIINHKGLIEKRLSQFKTAVLQSAVQPHQGSTPYTIIGDYPIIILCIIMIFLGSFIQRHHSQRLRPPCV